jgi:hypothetical protein
VDVSGQHHAPAALLLGETPVLIEEEAEWVLETYWTIWKREKMLSHDGIRNLDRSACSPLALWLRF